MALGVRVTGGLQVSGAWISAGLLLGLLVALNKVENDLVHVARHYAGMAQMRDAEDVRVPSGGLLRQARRIARFVPFHRVFHSIELSLLVLVAALVSRDWVQQRLGTRRRPSRRVVAQAFDSDFDPDSDADAAALTERSAGQPGIGVLRRSVLVEVVGAVVVLAVSAVLVSQLPATASVAAPVEVTLPLQSASGTTGTGTVQVSLEPATPGPTTLHVHLFDAEGRLTQPRQITVTLTEVQQQIGPLDVDLSPAGPGQYVGDPVLPAGGSWTLAVTVRLDEFTAVTASTVFPVR